MALWVICVRVAELPTATRPAESIAGSWRGRQAQDVAETTITEFEMQRHATETIPPYLLPQLWR